MKILKVIHGYPPYYSAGSEVYSQLLAHSLADDHEVQVFTRCENSFLTDFAYSTALDDLDPRILLHLLNMPLTRYRYKFINRQVDARFSQLLREFKPHVVHFGHLNHLSLNLPVITASLNIPSVFTLHDFWLSCPRGRFIQRNSQQILALCDKQEARKCAKQCYSGYFTGDPDLLAADLAYWESWVAARMMHTKKIVNYIDHFIAPSHFLLKKFTEDFAIAKEKITYLDYGFNLNRLTNRKRVTESKFVFGYIGTHTQEKGIDLLLRAFVNVEAKLKIWGAVRTETKELAAIVEQLPVKVKNNIEWMGSYRNENIVKDVFNKVDAIIVPSIWGENSPLVIHEAQQVRVPVITANYGGMAEYVKDGVNGLLFEHRDFMSLSARAQVLAQDRALYNKLATRGYLYSRDGQIPAIEVHAREIVKIYQHIATARQVPVALKPGPWRITFDTNPDYCNYSCIMCECFSPYSKVKAKNKAKGIKPKIMPIALIRKIIQEAVGTPLKEIIPSTMGEPLMYENFTDIINLCHEFGLKLNLTTNGSFIIKGAKKWAELLVPVLSDIKISWNGATKETHEKIMRGSKWEHVTENLKTFLNVRDNYANTTQKTCSVTLQLTFLESNLDEIYDLTKMAIALGIDRIKGHHLWAHFAEIKHLAVRRNQQAIKRWNLMVKKLLKLTDEMLLPSGKKIKLENFNILSLDATEDLSLGGACPFLGKEAWINPAGKFSPCCAPDELRGQLGNFGSVNDTPLATIWRGEQYRDLQKNYLNYNLCKTCNMRKPLINQIN